MDALSAEDRLTLEVARSIREDYLQQDAFDLDDSYTPLDKQTALLSLIFKFRDEAKKAIDQGADIEEIASLGVREQISRAKSISFENYEKEYKSISEQIVKEMNSLKKDGSL